MDVSLDLESLSLAPNALILSIGVVPFSVTEGRTYNGSYYVLDPQNQRKTRDIDPATVTWWIDQAQTNPSASSVFTAPREDVYVALYALHTVLQRELDDKRCRIWANSPAFDCVALGSLFKDYGLTVPWRYSQERDFRTIRGLMKDIGEYSDADLGVPPNMNMHNALDDADWQARYLIRALRLLGVAAEH